MTDAKRKLMEKNLKELNEQKAAEAERIWMKGNKTAMEQDIIAAGRQVTDKPKKQKL